VVQTHMTVGQNLVQIQMLNCNYMFNQLGYPWQCQLGLCESMDSDPDSVVQCRSTNLTCYIEARPEMLIDVDMQDRLC
jgi:hypothetical protein